MATAGLSPELPAEMDWREVSRRGEGGGSGAPIRLRHSWMSSTTVVECTRRRASSHASLARPRRSTGKGSERALPRMKPIEARKVRIFWSTRSRASITLSTSRKSVKYGTLTSGAAISSEKTSSEVSESGCCSDSLSECSSSVMLRVRLSRLLGSTARAP